MQTFDQLYAAIDAAASDPSPHVNFMEAEGLAAMIANVAMGVRMLRGENVDFGFEQPAPVDPGQAMGSMMSRPAYARADLSIIRANVDRMKAALIG